MIKKYVAVLGLLIALLAGCAKKEVLSDNLYDFQVAIGNEVLQFPMSYEELIERGWKYEEGPAEILEAGYYSMFNVFSKNGLKLYFDIFNVGTDTAPIEDCLISGVYVKEEAMEGVKTRVILPGGIVFGSSTEQDLKNAYGEPTECYEGIYEIEYTYQDGDKTSGRIYISISRETQTVSHISVVNLTKPEKE